MERIGEDYVGGPQKYYLMKTSRNKSIFPVKDHFFYSIESMCVIEQPPMMILGVLEPYHRDLPEGNKYFALDPETEEFVVFDTEIELFDYILEIDLNVRDGFSYSPAWQFE